MSKWKKTDRSFEEWQYVEKQYFLQNANMQNINCQNKQTTSYMLWLSKECLKINKPQVVCRSYGKNFIWKSLRFLCSFCFRHLLSEKQHK